MVLSTFIANVWRSKYNHQTYFRQQIIRKFCWDIYGIVQHQLHKQDIAFPRYVMARLERLSWISGVNSGPVYEDNSDDLLTTMTGRCYYDIHFQVVYYLLQIILSEYHLASSRRGMRQQDSITAHPPFLYHTFHFYIFSIR
jgi:hypothetical protein